MELYKYCKVGHREMLLARGCLRVGTLNDFRRTDKYGEMVSDANDGTRVSGGTISNLSAENEHLYPGLAVLRKSKLINIDLSGGGKVGSIRIGRAISESPNLLIFSTSSAYSLSTHERWYKAEGYDACYKILSARLFFRAISQALGTNYRFLGFSEVVYADTIDLADPRSHTHPALIKHPSNFSEQVEVRAAWTSDQDPAELKPILIETSRAGIYAIPHSELLSAKT